ncbi:stalk domain-containing protein [Paenibacillus lemnae]|uniref:Copper amine oxidase-like N-terminal domain-containing protein n=1 Tax=Paenibacillus lemnae TaxID=1330551 RepID=A0A848M941_PAELE|nr:stalk domain-containing protein [Paenibacillus lemnae]NMO97126.1 hypothetical protein [Paenibacillus lemnae]
MKDKVKGIVIGLILGTMLTGVTAYSASSTNIKAVLNKVNLYVDGVKKSTANTITYKNTTYVPVRAMSNALNKDVSLKGDNLFIGKQPNVKVTQDKAFDLVYTKIKKESDKYKLHYMDEGVDGSYYIVRAFENMPTHIATYGWYYVDMYTGVVYEWDLVENELIKL